MKVDRDKAVGKSFVGESFYFCSEHCLRVSSPTPMADHECCGGLMSVMVAS